MRRTAATLVALAAMMMAAPAGAQSLGAGPQPQYQEFNTFSPQRAFALSADGRSGYTWGNAGGADPGRAVESVLKHCAERSKSECALYAVNNIVLNGRPWKAAAPATGPAIGRLRAQPWWDIKGSSATGLVVWSHGYMEGNDATASAPLPHVGYFLQAGYDLYRFDREYIRDWPGDATALAEAVRLARARGYRRIVLAGQSAGAWVSVAAAMRGAAVDGVISVAAAHHGYVTKMSDPTRARSEWQQLVRGIKAGPRIVLVNFALDEYDVGGRMDDAREAFAANKMDAVILAEPEGFKGHGAGSTMPFKRKYGPCMFAFIETGARQVPCG
jgi:pimeloyl-ACP methyl ester carboxylesterase